MVILGWSCKEQGIIPLIFNSDLQPISAVVSHWELIKLPYVIILGHEKAIMAQGCCIAVIRIKVMNWSAICWYQLYLIVTHHRSDSRGHGVTSCRKYSLKIMPWLVRVELCKIRCPLTQQASPVGDTYTKTSFRSASTINIRGWPSAPTVGPQWPNKVRKCPREEWQQSTNACTRLPTADQQPVGSSRTLWTVSLEEASSGRKLAPSPT